MMLYRRSTALLGQLLTEFPALAILGPRQVGKTTLALELARTLPAATYLDLESPADAAKLADPTAYFEAHRDELTLPLESVSHSRVTNWLAWPEPQASLARTASG